MKKKILIHLKSIDHHYRNAVRLALLVVGFHVLVAMSGLAQDRVPERDTTAGPDFIVTPRINSAGHFPFTGSLINRHVNADLNVFYENRNNGFFVFKSHDLQDPHSIVNYLQPGIFRRIPITRKFYLRLFFGYLFSQTSGFRDRDSDFYTAGVGYWTLADNLTVENTALFFDLLQSTKLANRFLASWTPRTKVPFKIQLYVWHRLVFDSIHNSTSASFALNFPDVKLSHSVSVQATISYQGYISESKPAYARRDGFLASLAFPIVIKNR